jgi:glycine/D-amino acid oxidase-like deaminating enzyme
MGARRSPVFAEGVLWHRGVQEPPISPRPLPAEADVVVIGGGYLGLAAARELAAAGRHVVVVEADAIGTGASTRNGGMVIPELKAGPAALERRYGPLGRRLYADVNAAFDHVESLVADGGIDCDYHRWGQLYLAHNHASVEGLRHMAAEHQRAGEDVRFVEPGDLHAEIGSTAFHGGVVFERTGGLQPARFHAGLARLALAAGAEVHEQTRALSIDNDLDGAVGITMVVTDRGPIRAAQVLVATNATADTLLPQLRRRVLPVGSFIVATEVLDPELARSVAPTGRMMVDTKNLLFYWRLTPDGRLAFGGRRSLAPSTVTEAADFLYDAMVRLHPQLSDVAIDAAWGGEVAMTLDRMPHVGRLGSAWYATGCNGSGVALMPWLGVRMAAVLLGHEEPPSFAELRHRPIPASSQRRWWLPLVGQWFLWQDRRS